MKVKYVPLPDIWRICNKIRAAIFRVGLNLYDYFKPLDPNNNCLISEKQFISVLGRQIRNQIGLSDQEISELADYFRVQDGRIFYTQLCEVIHKSVPDFSKNEPLTSGTEWDDPLHENVLGPAEERRVNIIMTKIASLVNTRQLILRPFFQDYELISKSCGVITIAHFGRILYFLGIHLCADEFNVLVKKYLKDSYTLSYNAFLAKLDAIARCWEKHGFTDVGGDLLNQFPGRLINAELPKLPRPELDVVSPKEMFGTQRNFHPILAKPPPPDDLVVVMKRIQRHVFTNRIRTTDFFQTFDRLNCGKITCNQFERGLAGLRLYLSQPEIWQILMYYRDPNDKDRVCWKTFADDVDQVFTIKELEKWPECEVEQFPQDVKDLPKRGQATWIDVEPDLRNLCEETLEKIKQKVKIRRLNLKPDFKNYDKSNRGYVSGSQYRQVLTSNYLLLADEEYTALEARFSDEVGFNYFWFLSEIEPKPLEEPQYNELMKKLKKINCREAADAKEGVSTCERDIVMILGKIKAKVVRERIDIYPFLKDYDPLSERFITKDNFVRGLSTCGICLTNTEFEVLMNTFSAPMRPCYVDYVTFVRTVDEAFTQPDLERAPLLIPTPHYPSESDPRNFLNFEERQLVAVALEKLASVGDRNLEEVFADYDKSRCGTVTRQRFIIALSIRNMIHLISSPETDAISKAFSYYKGTGNEIDYRAFLRALEILRVNLKRKPV